LPGNSELLLSDKRRSLIQHHDSYATGLSISTLSILVGLSLTRSVLMCDVNIKSQHV